MYIQQSSLLFVLVVCQAMRVCAAGAIEEAPRTNLVTYNLGVTAVPELNPLIDVDPDPDEATPFNRDMDEGLAVTLVAPLTHAGYSFFRWRLDGVPQPVGENTVALTMDAPHAAEAEYLVLGVRLYVDDSAAGAEDGSSWSDAFTDLQDALALARAHPGSVSEIWVAQGTYYPAPLAGDRSLSFDLVDGTALYGGFEGTESLLEERDLEAGFETILSGDLNGDDGADFANDAENSYHVVTATDINTEPALSGFTVTGGNANGTTLAERRGGGLWIAGGSLSLEHCTVTGNAGGSDINAGGGGVFAELTSLSVLNSTISQNRTANGPYETNGGYGGGAHFRQCSYVFLSDCLISENITGNGGAGPSPGSGGSGGGLSSYSSNLHLDGCTISQNTTGNGGGRTSGFGSFAAGWGGSGAGIFLDGSETTIVGCSITQNVCGNGGNTSTTADGGNGGRGGGLYVSNNVFPPKPVIVENCLVSENAAGDGGFASGSVDGGNGGRGGGIEVLYGPVQVRNSQVTDNRAGNGVEGGPGGDGGAVYFWAANDSLIENCLIAGNEAGNGGGNGGKGGGIYNYSADNLQIVNVTIVNNAVGLGGTGSDGIAGGCYAEDPANILNSIVWANFGGAGQTIEEAQIGGNCTANYSNIQGWTGGFGGVGNFGLDPLFIDGDPEYHLQSLTDGDPNHSPCIDAGDPASDYSSEPEPNGQRINMGAYGNTAQAERSQLFTLIYTAGPFGSILGSTLQVVENHGDGTEVVAIPTLGYHFASWSDGYPTANRTDENVQASINVTATFAFGLPAFSSWVDFAWAGAEFGTEAEPWNTLAEGVAAVEPYGTVKIKGDTAQWQSGEALRITKAVRLEAVGGAVRVGVD